MSGLFRWLVGLSALAQLIGAALIIRGLKAVPVSNPFIPLAYDPERVDRPAPPEREHPLALAVGTLLFVLGLALAAAQAWAGAARQDR